MQQLLPDMPGPNVHMKLLGVLHPFPFTSHVASGSRDQLPFLPLPCESKSTKATCSCGSTQLKTLHAQLYVLECLRISYPSCRPNGENKGAVRKISHFSLPLHNHSRMAGMKIKLSKGSSLHPEGSLPEGSCAALLHTA